MWQNYIYFRLGLVMKSWRFILFCKRFSSLSKGQTMNIPSEVKWENENLTKPWVTETLTGPHAYVPNNRLQLPSGWLFNLIFLEPGTSTYTLRNCQMKEADVYSSSSAGATGDVGKSKQLREKLRMWWNFEKGEWTMRWKELKSLSLIDKLRGYYFPAFLSRVC